jgi:phosphopantetheinyl transferase (holo-ACP synthase)
MIIGLGSDLCNIERIQHSLDRFGERFEARVFTDVERAKALPPRRHSRKQLARASNAASS